MIPSTQAHLRIAAATNSGRKGKNNEDRYAVAAFQLSKPKPTPVVFAVIADGIGGHRAGEVAAEMAVENISQIVAQSDGSAPLETLKEAITQTSRLIYTRAQAETPLAGMGTTCACCWVIGNDLYTANVGDSRLYLIRSGKIQQISTDHTWVQEALDLGILTQSQALSHPNMHIIRRFLGSADPPEVDLRLRLHPEESDAQSIANQGLKLNPGDQVLLCTDGLTDLVTDAEILAALRSSSNQAALDRLIDLANQRGGHDNITAVLLQYPGSNLEKGEPGQKGRKYGLGIAAILLLLATIAAAAWLGYREWEQNRSPGKNAATQTAQAIILPAIQTATAALSSQATWTSESNSFSLSATQTTNYLASPTIQPTPTMLLPTITPWPTNTISP